MIRKFILVVGALALAVLAGCSTAQQAKVQTIVVDINTQVKQACAVFQPVALDAQTLYALDPKVDLGISAMNGLCAANAAIDPTSVQTIANTTLPAAIKGLGTVTGVNPQTVQAVGAALTLANAALNLWVQNYVPATPTAASAPAAASTPLAGAPLQ